MSHPVSLLLFLLYALLTLYVAYAVACLVAAGVLGLAAMWRWAGRRDHVRQRPDATWKAEWGRQPGFLEPAASDDDPPDALDDEFAGLVAKHPRLSGAQIQAILQRRLQEHGR